MDSRKLIAIVTFGFLSGTAGSAFADDHDVAHDFGAHGASDLAREAPSFDRGSTGGMTGGVGSDLGGRDVSSGRAASAPTPAPASSAQEKERERLQKVDPPITPSALGNGIVSGIATAGVTSVTQGVAAAAAAAAATTARSTALGLGAQAVKDAKASKESNAQSGRGGPNDPRYNPGTLVNH